MARYIGKKLFAAILILLIVTFISYIIMSVLPGDAALVALGNDATPQRLAELRAELGLDKPVMVRYFIWLGNAVKGDFGYSIQYSTDCLSVLQNRLPVTALIGAISLVISIIFGILLGIIAAVHRGKIIDTIVNLFANLGIALPAFWLGLMLIILFAVKLGWVPVQGYVAPSEGIGKFIKYAILPCFTLALGSIATIARQTRSAVLETLHQNHVKTARAKGLNKFSILNKHILKNSMIPVLTLLGFQVRNLVGGSVVVEQIFNIPGMGRTLVQSVKSLDTNMVLACLLTITIITIISNLLVDIAYGFIDPRIRKGSIQ